MQIVIEQDEIVFNSCVVSNRRPDIDRTVSQRGVTDGVIDSKHVAHLQTAPGAERRPSILAVEKFVGQTNDQFGSLLRRSPIV
jgi:hypothetical protein